MLGGGEAEVKGAAHGGTACIPADAGRGGYIRADTAVRFKALGQQPGLWVILCSRGFSVENCKKFHTTVDQVREMNEIDGEEAGAGARLLLIKEVTAGNCS